MQIYVDNAATTKLSDQALEKMLPYLKEAYGNPSSLYTLGQQAKEAIEEARAKMASYLGCFPKDIVFTSGGSEADNQALLSAAAFGKRQGKKHIISSAIEHHAILHTLDKLEKEGFEVTLLPVYEDGIVRIDDLKAAIREDTVLVTIMYANNEIGTIQPITEIAEVCAEKGILFHTDAVQAVGHLPINCETQKIDLLSLSAHKFHGPKGAGVLVSRGKMKLISLIEGGAQERHKRAGTENVPAIVGMAAAFEEAVKNQEADGEKCRLLRDHLQNKLLQIEHSKLNGAKEQRIPGTLNMCFEGIEGESLLLLLDDKGIAASSGSACTSGELDPSHVLLALGLPHEVAHGSLRISLTADNTMEEMDYMAKSIEEVVTYLRNISPVWKDLQKGTKQYVI